MTAPAAPVLDLPGAPSPLEALDRLSGVPGRVLLESCPPAAGRTLLGAAPPAVFEVRGPASFLRAAPWVRLPADAEVSDPLARVERLLAATRVVGGEEWAGGWLGFFGYELAGLLERLPEPHPEAEGVADLHLAAHDWLVVWEPGRSGARIVGTPLPGDAGATRLLARMEGVRRLLEAEGEDGAGTAGEWRQRISSDVAPCPASPSRLEGAARPAAVGGPLEGTPGAWTSLPRDAYRDGVARIRRYIRAGDLFQANLTHRITVAHPGTGTALYRRLRGRSPAPYAAYLDLGAGGEVSSISPEGFLSLRGDRVETRPIKGTAPRDPDPATDRRNAAELLASAKDRAENVMIVDLLRNDLSRVCRPGSVEVPLLVGLETHPTVHHLVSTVRGRLRSGTGPVDLLRATFPGGSITGAPKIRAIEILHELEPVRRGVYTGAIGILTFRGDVELSVAIRTAVTVAGRAHYGTGGGITLASDPDAEWAESLHKAKAFLDAVSGEPKPTET